MNWFENILKALDGRMETPTAYGWFHIMSICIMLALIVVVCIFCRKTKMSEKAYRIITITVASVMILFEVYKQLNFSFNSSTGTWDYQWYAFPFQFCSTPMYVLLLAGLVRPGKFREFLCSFLATFGLLAGLLVMVMPGDVFISTIGINIQTMVHHGMMVVIGIFMWVSGNAKLNVKTALKALAVFAVIVAIAIGLNEIVYASGVLIPQHETFNMFFISRHFPSTLPVFSMIYPKVPWVVFVLIYFVGFAIGALIITLIAMLIGWICSKIAYKKNNNSTHVDGERIKY